MKKKKIQENVTRSFKKAEEFDIKFWRRAGVRARFAAAWKAVEEFYKFKGKHGHKPRLRRAVQNIKQV
ncbi:MAG: hypothetical protein ISS34_07830 [Candidatus Omnitrophica bacterium]|nr:hypothetical protein [Candidatus Omnitrophota bacterium]